MTTLSAPDIQTNLARVCEQVDAAARRVGRDPSEITLLGVTKTHSAAVVVQAVQVGLMSLGENRVQEAAVKIPEVDRLLAAQGQLLRPRWHMVGHLQTNKARAAVGLFDTVDSVDSLRLAQTLDRAVQAEGGGPLPVLLEVYFGDDPSRTGFRPDQVSDAAGQILELPHLDVEGLMTIAPLGWDEAATRGVFRALRDLRDRLARAYPRSHWRHLSMGMSEDFVPAIEEGSTIVRIGRAIFGPREAR